MTKGEGTEVLDLAIAETESTPGAETVGEIGHDLVLDLGQDHESVAIETKMINTKVVNQVEKSNKNQTTLTTTNHPHHLNTRSPRDRSVTRVMMITVLHGHQEMMTLHHQ